MLQHQGNGTRPCSSLTSKQTTQGKGGGTATNRQTLKIDVTQLTTARNAIRCRRQSSSKETSRSFNTIRPKRKEPLIKAGSQNRDTHRHRQQLFTKAKKKNPTDTIVHGRKRTSHLRHQAKLVPDRPRDCCHAATPTKNPLTDRYLSRCYRILSQRAHSRGEGLLYHAKKSSIYHKRAQKQTVFLFVCLSANLP
jgi:hypothetical protein